MVECILCWPMTPFHHWPTVKLSMVHVALTAGRLSNNEKLFSQLYTSRSTRVFMHCGSLITCFWLVAWRFIPWVSQDVASPVPRISVFFCFFFFFPSFFVPSLCYSCWSGFYSALSPANEFLRGHGIWINLTSVYSRALWAIAIVINSKWYYLTIPPAPALPITFSKYLTSSMLSITYSGKLH